MNRDFKLHSPNWLAWEGRTFPVQYVRNFRARRYILRVNLEGIVRITIPRGGSIHAAWEFARKNSPWIFKQWERQKMLHPRAWSEGTEILFRGSWVKLQRIQENGTRRIGFGQERILVEEFTSDWRSFIEAHLWKLGRKELPERTAQLASSQGLEVRGVTVRNQRSRWGSCSIRGAISLNWRLVQTPEFVRDYIILHELAHLRVMNHSPRFWECVARTCPGFESAEEWLRKNSDFVRSGRRPENSAEGVLGCRHGGVE